MLVQEIIKTKTQKNKSKIFYIKNWFFNKEQKETESGNEVRSAIFYVQFRVFYELAGEPAPGDALRGETGNGIT